MQSRSAHRSIRYALMSACWMALTQSSSLTFALTPEQVFEKASPSIVIVHAYAKNEKTLATLGSGIIFRPNLVVTNCHVLSSGRTFVVKSRQRQYSAKLRAADPDRDLCLLDVDRLNGKPVELGDLNTLRPGARAYAIGSPQGLELTISEGLVSGIRPLEDSTLIQTSAPISEGSSGGGLFDSNGRLIGITSFMLKDSQNLNFALPVDWVARLLEGRAIPGPAQQLFGSGDVPGGAPSRWLAEMSERLPSYVNDRTVRHELLTTLYYEARRAGLDPQLVLALTDHLSGFRARSVSRAGARGYMHVMPSWITRIGTPQHDLHDLRTNLRYGCTILRHYIDAHNGDLFQAVNTYINNSLGRPEGYNVDGYRAAHQVLALFQSKWKYQAND